MDTTPLRMKIDDDTELRILEEQDAPHIFALVDQNRSYLKEWLPWVDLTRSVEDEIDFIHSLSTQHAKHQSFGYGIWYNNQLTGTIGCHAINWSDKKVEIGYWLAASFQGKGLMTKACKAMVTYAFNELRLAKVEIRCALKNKRSRAIPERLGFKEEGIIKDGEWLYDHFVDLVVYGMFSHEWNWHNGS